MHKYSYQWQSYVRVLDQQLSYQVFILLRQPLFELYIALDNLLANLSLIAPKRRFPMAQFV